MHPGREVEYLMYPRWKNRISYASRADKIEYSTYPGRTNKIFDSSGTEQSNICRIRDYLMHQERKNRILDAEVSSIRRIRDGKIKHSTHPGRTSREIEGLTMDKVIKNSTAWTRDLGTWGPDAAMQGRSSFHSGILPARAYQIF